MLYYNRIDLNEEIDPAKSNSIKKYIACHYWFCNQDLTFKILFVMVVSKY